MGRSQQSFGKKEREKKRKKNREDKAKKREERAENSVKGQGLDSMIAYVDEYGFPTDVAPEARKKVDAKSIELGIPKKEEGDDDPTRTGKVAFFNHDKGYGFISELGGGEKYFVHVSGCLEPVAENDSVSFELEKGPKGMNAVRVKKYVEPPKKVEPVVDEDNSEESVKT